MFKKVFILILSIISLTYLFFFSGFFSLNLNPTQSESLFFSTKIYLFSALTCFLQVVGIVFNINLDTTILYATIFLVISLIIGVIVIEKQLKTIFDKDGNRKI